MSKLASLLSPVTWFNALGGSRRVTETRDIAFGPGERDNLDIYAPTNIGAGPCPTVVFFYGGGWEEGERGLYRFVGAALAERGIVVAIPDYRVFPETRFPGFIEDGARAVAWVHENIATYGGDPDRLVLVGHSAGGHIAAMLALDDSWLRSVGVGTKSIRGLVGLAGPYDFLPLHSEVLKTIFGPQEKRWASQPINFVTDRAPPALLVTGQRDTVVDPGNATRLAQRIRDKGGRAEVRIYPRVGHGTLLGAFFGPLRLLAPALADTSDFVARVTAPDAVLRTVLT